MKNLKSRKNKLGFKPTYLKNKILFDCKLGVSVRFTTTNHLLKTHENEADESQLYSCMRNSAWSWRGVGGVGRQPFYCKM